MGITLHEPLLELYQKLPNFLPLDIDMFFFGNSGAEAVEGAIKLARFVTNRIAIIAFVGSFHSRTYNAPSITSVKSKYCLRYEPFVIQYLFCSVSIPFSMSVG